MEKNTPDLFRTEENGCLYPGRCFLKLGSNNGFGSCRNFCGASDQGMADAIMADLFSPRSEVSCQSQPRRVPYHEIHTHRFGPSTRRVDLYGIRIAV